jgi:hypothetical protein
MWDLWWTKRHWGRFSANTSVSPVSHSTDCSTLIIIRGWYSRPVVATVIVDSVPLHTRKKKKGGKKKEKKTASTFWNTVFPNANQ